MSPSAVTPATTAGSLPPGHYSYSTTGSSSLTAAGPMAGRSEGSFLAAATAGGALEFGSTVGTHAGSMGGSLASTGGSFSGLAGGLGRSFTTKQVASSTNAVATGITEKLNAKRIDAAMSEPEEDSIAALQLIAQIGEGGFAKVFRGLYRCGREAARHPPWPATTPARPATPRAARSLTRRHAAVSHACLAPRRGLVVAVKVVSVGDPSTTPARQASAAPIGRITQTGQCRPKCGLASKAQV